MSRIAIIHFTAGDVPGGIERIIDAQVRALTEAGHRVRVIAGAGSAVDGAETILLPELKPDHRLARPDQVTPENVRSLAALLSTLLAECDQCWVHNIFSIVLHPAMAAALRELVYDTPARRWLAWCEDISACTAFTDATAGASLPPWGTIPPNISWITISSARRRELAAELRIHETEISVVPPPIDVARRLVVETTTEALLAHTNALNADVRVLIVAKLLPHKNLSRAVGVAAALRERCRRPVIFLTAAPSVHQPDLSRQIRKRLQDEIEARDVRDTLFILTPATGAPPSTNMIRDLMFFCDVLFVPSLEEGFGLPVVEAIAARLPSVCFDLPALREAGGAAADFLPLTASDDEIAVSLLAHARNPINQRRQELWASAERFRQTILRLADAGRYEET